MADGDGQNVAWSLIAMAHQQTTTRLAGLTLMRIERCDDYREAALKVPAASAEVKNVVFRTESMGVLRVARAVLHVSGARCRIYRS